MPQANSLCYRRKTIVKFRINETLHIGEVRNLEEIRRNTQAKTPSKNPTRGGESVSLFLRFTINDPETDLPLT